VDTVKEVTVKLIKYVTALLLFLIAFIFVGEIYVWNIDNFETEYKYVTFYQQENTTAEEMKSDIYETANKENVEVFVVIKRFTSLFSENIDIYTTGTEAEYYLAQESEIKEGIYESIFLGNVKVEFHEWTEIPNIGEIETYYVIGEDEKIVSFKAALVDKYAGKFPREGYQVVNSRRNIGVVWSCVILFLLLLTFYEAARSKKAVILRITLGEQILFYVLKQILIDIAVYSVIFIGLIHTLKFYTNPFFRIADTCFFFFAFLGLNSCAYFWLVFTNYRKDTQTKQSVQMVLKISYLYKILTSILIIFTMAGCIELIFNGINCYRQKGFFEARKEFSYITVKGYDFEDSKEMLSSFYCEAESVKEEMCLVDLGNWQTKAEYILADKGAEEYLRERIAELQNQELEEKIYYLVPEKYLENKEIIEEMQSVCYAYLEEEYEYEIIGYEETAWVMAVSNTGKVKSVLKKNPIVILNHNEVMKIPNSSILYLINAVMFSITDEKFESIAYENEFIGKLYYKTNVYENYMYFWGIMKRNMVMGIVFFAILLMLEGLILRSIIKYEYQIHAKELLLSKIQGDGFFYRHRNMLGLTLGGWGSLFVVILICFMVGITSVLYVAIGGICVMLTEYLFMAVYSHRLENINISKIFKGRLV